MNERLTKSFNSILLIFEGLYHTNSSVKIAKGGDQMSSVKSFVMVNVGILARQENSFFLGAAY